MIIDIHTHSFPEKIAERAIAKLQKSSDMKAYLNGTVSDLIRSMRENGISYSVLLPVVTAPGQQETINRTAIEINEHTDETGLISLGGIHPENENYREILTLLSSHGVKGIKLHPVFQNTYFDDIRYLRIVDYAASLGMIILVHAGFDISFPTLDYVTPAHIRPLLKEVKPDKLILAHMGGWNCWDDVEELLAIHPVYLDTSFTLTPMKPLSADSERPPLLSENQFLKLAQAAGYDHVLFGSDSPWSSQADSINVLKKTGLPQDVLDDILGNNAARLLGFMR